PRRKSPAALERRPVPLRSQSIAAVPSMTSESVGRCGVVAVRAGAAGAASVGEGAGREGFTAGGASAWTDEVGPGCVRGLGTGVAGDGTGGTALASPAGFVTGTGLLSPTGRLSPGGGVSAAGLVSGMGLLSATGFWSVSSWAPAGLASVESLPSGPLAAVALALGGPGSPATTRIAATDFHSL